LTRETPILGWEGASAMVKDRQEIDAAVATDTCVK
jgi:hypothetical protein